MIRYFSEDIKFVLKDKLANNRWLKMVAGSEIRTIGDINIIFCSDNYILDVNMRYLQHDYFTDIITFDYCEGKKLSGALAYGAEFDEELHRVMVHGLLHLIGYDDHTPEEEKQIHEKEDYYLKLRNIVG